MQRLIRMAHPEDAGALLAIYSPYVLETTVTFEYDVPTLSEFRSRVEGFSADYPYLVYAIDDKIVGYAYAHRLWERAAYGWNVELSVYVDGDCRHMGIGPALYRALLDILREQKLQNAYACITLPNPDSLAMHERFGFRLVGRYENTGFKFGAWRDVEWLVLPLGAHEVPPAPFLPIGQIDPARIQAILEKYVRPAPFCSPSNAR